MTPEQREKNRVTVVSLLAAVALTSAKLAAGLLTGSLGLLAEAAHSGLDTVASVITFFSVRVAGRPADTNHPYGHGRFENLSAVIQGVLLLGTAAWILYESVQRIFFVHVEVQTSFWAFAVMGASIVVDFWRSRMLARAARKYNSRAIEADALNFRADMLSSVVVLVGLSLSAYGAAVGSEGFLQRADAWAALLVGLFIIGKSGQLALRSVNILLDLAPVELQERVTRAAESVPGVVGTRLVRLRESGDRKFADIVVTVPRTLSAAEAHEISERVEESVRDIDPGTESVVHTEPVMSASETAAESIHAVALGMGLRTHHERVQREGDRLEASLHLEVDSSLTLGEAHDLARRLGTAIKSQNPSLRRVNTHIEVAEPEPGERLEVTADHGDLAREMKREVREADADAVCHEVRLYRSAEGGLDAVLHVDFPRSANVGEVHIRTEAIEQALREAHPQLEHVVIHAEPREETAP
ncbi:MAG TPA: cation diffusion facilitator family transporter [Rubrobacteraceae bacterium]|nr:cation diffusion facilitator family transporter [Rubrobacteraceae bacterium]